MNSHGVVGSVITSLSCDSEGFSKAPIVNERSQNDDVDSMVATTCLASIVG